MVQDIAEKEGGARVVALYLRMGALSCVSEEALRFAFEVVSRDTLAERAKLHFELIPVTVFCQACRQSSELPSIQSFLCPRCQRPTAQVQSGRELELARLELEEDSFAAR